MTQDDIHTIEAVRLADDRSPLASLLDRLARLLDRLIARLEAVVSRLEAVEADLSVQTRRVNEQDVEIRRLRTLVGGLVEHEQAREEAETGAAMLRRIDRAVNPAFASTLAHFSPLVPSEPRG